VPGPNTSSTADYAGNPEQKPERANGIDLAFEHFPASGGVVSVSFFSRRIKDLVRGVILLENVPWATSPRYVNRRRNIGNAISRGIEFDAKMKLNDVIDSAIAVDLRANVSLFDSRVDSVHGPNNRLNEQPRGKGNIGADYRFRDSVLTVGGTVSYTPAYTIQDTDTQLYSSSSTRAIDSYALWALSATSKLRLTISNLAPGDTRNSTAILTGGQLQTTANSNRGNATVALRIEIRL
jgi:iron complex outermembrane receptor protein